MTMATSTKQPEPAIPRAALGAGIGATIGWVMGGAVGAGVGAAAGALFSRSNPPSRKGVVTPSRMALYEKAMAWIESPERLEEIAGAFAAEELTAHAEMLRRKAALRRLTPEASAERRRHFLRGLGASKPDAIETLAANFHVEGARLAARELRRHAADMRAVAEKKVDEAVVQRLDRRLALVSEMFQPESGPVKSATANLDAARAAQTRQQEETDVAPQHPE
jgi:hypothetical protein